MILEKKKKIQKEKKSEKFFRQLLTGYLFGASKLIIKEDKVEFEKEELKLSERRK